MLSKTILNELSERKTPFYYYDLEILERTLDVAMKESSRFGYQIHYALKANSNEKILSLISSKGFGADCVSGNEVLRAAETGFSSEKIVFAGVGKSDDEIMAALTNGIYCFNSESLQEIEVINTIAEKLGKKAGIALRLNPNVDAKTHHYITTGLEENKFGINLWELDDVLNRMKELKHVELKGIHFHIGSQITDLQPFKSLCTRVNEILEKLKDRNIKLEHVNVGGGFGVDYYNPDKNQVADFKSYFEVFNRFLKTEGLQVHFELGRSLVAQCGMLITRVLFVKKAVTTSFVILDAGMTELIRPALYQSYHKIENLSRSSEPASSKYDVVGPVCESSDCFGKAVDLPFSERGDIFGIRTAGAYGEVMASNYNLRKLNPSVYSDEIIQAAIV